MELKAHKLSSWSAAFAVLAFSYTHSPTAFGFELEEIIVTAQRRQENQQDVPIAITALSGANLKEKGINDIVAVGNNAPNVTLRNSASFGGSSSILVSYVRGIGQNDFAFT